MGKSAGERQDGIEDESLERRRLTLFHNRRLSCSIRFETVFLHSMKESVSPSLFLYHDKLEQISHKCFLALDLFTGPSRETLLGRFCF